MSDDPEDDGPVRIPIEDDSVEDAADGGRSVGLVMLVLAVAAFAVVYLFARGDDDEEAGDPPF